MKFEITPAHDIPLAEQARIANASFAGYVGGWTDLDAGTLARFLLLQGSDLFYSRFVRNEEGLLGFGYINRTGDVLRLSGMGIIASARGTGAAGHLLEHLLGEARQRRDATMMLEVIQQNPRGVALYRRHQFAEIGPLYGWRRGGRGAVPSPLPELTEIPIHEGLRFPSARDYPDIPWQISRFAIARIERARAFQAESACIIISDPAVAPIRVHGLISPSNDWRALRLLLGSILEAHAEREFFAPAIWPEEYGREVFEPLGFAREPLSQFLMRLDL